MHSYSIDKDIRRKANTYIIIISILASSILTLIFGNVISALGTWTQNQSGLKQIYDLCNKLGVTTNFLGIPFLYGLLYWGYDKCIWKLPAIRLLHRIPDLNGKWEGTLISAYNNQSIKMNMEITQTWSKVSFISRYPETKTVSESNTGSILIERDGILKIGFGFINRARHIKAHMYDGYNILELDGEDQLYGRYFNNRNNSNVNREDGNVGTFELHRVE